jgi:hypothetical protein
MFFILQFSFPGQHLVSECRVASRGVSGFSSGQSGRLRSGDSGQPEVVQRPQLPLHAQRSKGQKNASVFRIIYYKVFLEIFKAIFFLILQWKLLIRSLIMLPFG